MRMKKGIISVSTIVVVILGVFFAIRFIGGPKSATNIKTTDDSIVQKSNEALTNEVSTNEVSTNEVSTNEVSTNANEESALNASKAQVEIKNTEGISTNEMDAVYINDKTNVGVYTVKKDDTVFSIAKAYMPSEDNIKIVEFIKNRNSMDDSYKISEGQKIVIPYEKTIETSKAVVSDVNNREYVIKKQDTLTSIAKVNMPTYAIKQAIEMIKETNKITDENDIKEGKHIYIPK